MKATMSTVFDGLLAPLGRCLTPESAREILSVRADERLRARIEELADKADAGELSAEERAEYHVLVDVGDWVALLQAKARHYLAGQPGT